MNSKGNINLQKSPISLDNSVNFGNIAYPEIDPV